jgi:hypothetical protein
MRRRRNAVSLVPFSSNVATSWADHASGKASEDSVSLTTAALKVEVSRWMSLQAHYFR